MLPLFHCSVKMILSHYYRVQWTKVNLGRFCPIPVRSGCFGPISGVSRFGPVGEGRFDPIS